MKEHTKNMHYKEELYPNDMNYEKLSQWNCQLWIRKVSGLDKF